MLDKFDNNHSNFFKDNEIFEAGLTYPAPSQKKAVDIADSYTSASQTVNYSAPSQKVKKAVNKRYRLLELELDGIFKTMCVSQR